MEDSEEGTNTGKTFENNKLWIPKDRRYSRRSTIVDRLAAISRKGLEWNDTIEDNQYYLTEGVDGIEALPPPDYYYRCDAEAFMSHIIPGNQHIGEDDNANDKFSSIARNVVENANRISIERNLYSYLVKTKLSAQNTYYNDDDIDVSFYRKPPKSVVIIGKPGVGKTTLAKKLVKKLNAAHISPEMLIEFYKNKEFIPFINTSIKQILEAGDSINDKIVMKLLQARVHEPDISHRGYVLDGFPILSSEQVDFRQQLNVMENLPVKPDFAIILHMQDFDLFKRRMEQKMDPQTGNTYIRYHYSKFDADANEFPNAKSAEDSHNPTSVSYRSLKNGAPSLDMDDNTMRFGKMANDFDLHHEDFTKPEVLDGSKDFLPLPPDVIFRLITRTEDNPSLINTDFLQYRTAINVLQGYVDSFDRRNVLEVNSYFAPTVIFRKVWEYLEGNGVVPSPRVIQIMRPVTAGPVGAADYGEWLGEDEDSEAPCPGDDDDTLPEIDWASAFKAVSVRGLIDPRFRWRLSRWNNYCPVALKKGRSIIGKPELATAFLDKVFFMSSQEAVEEFKLNPRRFLLPKMPTSPIKFFIMGHPLSGKTKFSKELASLTNGMYIDMQAEMSKRYEGVCRDFVYKKRLKYTLEARIEVDKENHKEWKRQERARRRAMHKWIDDYLRSIAEAEIRAALDADRDQRREERLALREEADKHAIEFPLYQNAGACQTDDGQNRFCWREFVRQMELGKQKWTHQQWLELAWDLFRQRRLHYKQPPRQFTNYSASSEDDEEFGEGKDFFSDEESIEGESVDEEEPEHEGEMEEDYYRQRFKGKKHKKRRKRRCRKLKIKTGVDVQTEVEKYIESDSSDLDPDHETEASIKMRYPGIPDELVEIVPEPTLVADSHPLVQERVEAKLDADKEFVDGVPPELYLEVLKRACFEAQAHYTYRNKDAHLSGGWVVDNILPDIEKFRLILRTPEVCPDQVLILKDPSDNHGEIYRRLKKIFKSIEETNALTGYSKKKKKKYKKRFSSEYLGEDETDFDDEASEGSDMDNPPEDDIYGERDLDIDVNGINQVIMSDQRFDIAYDSPTDLGRLSLDRHREQSPNVGDESLSDTIGSETPYALSNVWQGSQETPQDDTSDGKLKNSLMENKTISCELSAFVNTEPCTERRLKEDFRVITQHLRNSAEYATTTYSQECPPVTQNFTGDTAEDTFNNYLIPEDDTNFRLMLGSEDTPMGVVDDIPTPDELQSRADLTEEKLQEILEACPEDMSPEDQQSCMQREIKLKTVKIDTPKRRFFMQIRFFDEFMNMALPVLNEQGVKFRDIGLIDNRNILDKTLDVWNSLENRFQYSVQRVNENELREEDEDIRESLMKWGVPFEQNQVWGLPSRDTLFMDKRKRTEDETLGEISDSDEEFLGEGLDDVLASMQNKPDIYRKIVQKMEQRRYFGDFKYYCPVTYTEQHILRKGSPSFACRYRGRLYYLVDEESVKKFTKTPLSYLPSNMPKVTPPPRICITGSPGCGQEEVGLKMAKEHKVCFMNFRQRLHEIMKARFSRDIGPNKTGNIVPKYQSDELVKNAAPNDDLKPGFQDGLLYTGEVQGEEQTSSLSLLPHLTPVERKPSFDQLVDTTALRSLGIMDDIAIDSTPIGSIHRTERLTERKWKKLTKIESHIKAFIENGIQLPEEVLDEFILPLWREESFKSTGFILVGFPNTSQDVEYLISRNCIPEMIYIQECRVEVIRNRLIVDAVDKWHHDQNPTGLNRSSLNQKMRFDKMRANLQKAQRQRVKHHQPGFCKNRPFKYQTEGRPTIDIFKRETWDYKDSLSMHITKAIKHYYFIYSKGLKQLKQALNRFRIDWNTINTDYNIFEGKRRLEKELLPWLKYRSNIFEDSIRLSDRQANALVSTGFFSLSKFGRWCPVEIDSGNTALNTWYAPAITKIPVMYKRQIYFIAGPENAKKFETCCWSMANINAPLRTIPANVVMMGRQKSGKTTIAEKLKNQLGLVYISGPEIIEEVSKHSFAAQYAEVIHDVDPTAVVDHPQPMLLAEEVLRYLSSGFTLPKYLLYRVLDFALMEPRAQHHGVVMDDYPVLDHELEDLLYRGLIPTNVFQLNIDLPEIYSRSDKSRMPNYNFDTIPELVNQLIDTLVQNFDALSFTACSWFSREVQNLTAFEATQNPGWIARKAIEKTQATMRKLQQYTVNVLAGQPTTLEGTCPLTSQLFLRLSKEFGFYCPVSLIDNDDLIKVSDITTLDHVVEYQGSVYVFASANNVKKFMTNPQKYTPPNCTKYPPAEVPIVVKLGAPEFEHLKPHWGFLDFDPVRYYDANHNPKGLQRGSHEFCVAYLAKLYCFLNQENLNTFMKKPHRYYNQILPEKIPRTEALDMDKISPYCYLLAKGVLSELQRMIQVVGDRRPRVPFMDINRVTALYMGYYLKTQNMSAEYETRQKYRNAMFEMMTLKRKADQFLDEIKKQNGKYPNIPDRLRGSLQDFLRMETLPDGKKVLVPTTSMGIMDERRVCKAEQDSTKKHKKTQEIIIEAELQAKLEQIKALDGEKQFNTIMQLLNANMERSITPKETTCTTHKHGDKPCPYNLHIM